jgi:hypothetical protein
MRGQGGRRNKFFFFTTERCAVIFLYKELTTRDDFSKSVGVAGVESIVCFSLNGVCKHLVDLTKHSWDITRRVSSSA